MTTVAITGHRPEDIPDIDWVYHTLMGTYEFLKVSHVIQGMAAGVDLWSARAAYDAAIPYTCARPWKGHAPRVADRNMYANALKYASRVVDVNPSETYIGKQLYFERNHWMVDNADAVISVWTGKQKGGTFEATKYAFDAGKKIYRLDPERKKIVGWIETLHE